MERCEKEAQDKLSTYREKYAKMKCDNKELQEVCCRVVFISAVKFRIFAH